MLGFCGNYGKRPRRFATAFSTSKKEFNTSCNPFYGLDGKTRPLTLRTYYTTHFRIFQYLFENFLKKFFSAYFYVIRKSANPFCFTMDIVNSKRKRDAVIAPRFSVLLNGGDASSSRRCEYGAGRAAR
jgi:hypothetical protein